MIRRECHASRVARGPPGLELEKFEVAAQPPEFFLLDRRLRVPHNRRLTATTRGGVSLEGTMKRSSYMRYDEVVELGRRGLKIWAYGKNKKYVCRVEINAAGLALYAGKKGKRLLANCAWERLVEKLTPNGES